ncbi:MAG: lipopolysaccharide biosynthesis protein [Desulfovibrio sp.]
MAQTKTTAQRIASYFSSMVFKQVLGLVVAILRPKLLSPEHYGLYSLLKVIPGYAAFVPLGARQTARFSIPRLQGEGREDLVLAMQSSLYFGTFWGNLLFLAIFFCVALPEAVTTVHYVGVGTFGLFILINWYFEYQITLLKAHQRFDLVSQANYLSAFMACGTLPLLYFFGIYGLFAAMVLAIVVISAMIHVLYPLPVLPRFDWREYVRMMREGFPIMCIGLAILAIRTTDRFVISGMLGTEQLGFYAIAVMIFNFLMNLPTVSREIMEPMLMQSLAQRDERENLDRFLFGPLLHTLYLLPVLVGGAFFAAPLFLPLLLPQYTAGVPVTQILVVGSFFLGLCYVLRGILVARGWQYQALLVAGGVFIANLVGSIGLVHAGWGIEGVGLASTFSFALLFTGLLTLIRVRVGTGYDQWSRILGAVLCSSIVMIVFLVGFRTLAGQAWQTWNANIIGGLAYLAVMAIVIWHGIRTHPELAGITVRTLFGGRKET